MKRVRFLFVTVLAGFAVLLTLLSRGAARYDAPATTLTFTDRESRVIGTINPSYQGLEIWTPISSIPKAVITATLEQEDRTFYWHPGINPWATLKAAVRNIVVGRIAYGGSTITQQLAKNLIQERSPQPLARSFDNKVRATLLALGLELRHPKNWILERYLNTAFYGRRCYGVAAAAKKYFNKDLEELTSDEIEKITSLTRAPSRLSRLLPSLGDVGNAGFYGRHFITTLAKRAQAADQKRGNIIRTTLDLDLQAKLEVAVKNVLAPRVEIDSKLNAAAVVIDVASGDVIAMVGSRDYFASEADGAVNAAFALRQPGSTLKPFTYFAAFARGFTPETRIGDVPSNFSVASADEAYMPQNFDRRYHGDVTVREALANSYNVPAVAVLNRIGLSYYHEVLRKFGFSTLNKSPQHYGLAVTLGSGEVSLVELTNAYAALARGGQFKPYRLMVDDPAPVGVKILPDAEKFSSQITAILSDSGARLKTFGFNESLDIDGIDVAVKTGTSYDLHDNWTVGYTTAMAVGVWVGHADATPLKDTTGATGAAPVWHALMESLVRNAPPQPFALPARKPHRQRRKYAAPDSNPIDWMVAAPLAGSRYRRHPWLPPKNQKIRAEILRRSGETRRFSWTLDGEPLGASDLDPFTAKAHVWLDPEPGSHVLKVEADDGSQREVRFSVLESNQP